ncbi:MAG: DinB family protein, partial [Flavobacteriaceae bacterium]|nr:DinB family protein [Flavobacteriaceae bacterium]
MKAAQLVPEEYGSYYQSYINLVGEQHLLTALSKSGEKVIDFLSAIPEEIMHKGYAEGKWSIKEIIVHLMDTERVFAYRALRFARRDITDLPGFEHNDYVHYSNANSRSKADLLSEYKAIRHNTLSLYR